MLLNVKQVKNYLHENNKQISKDALEMLNVKVEDILLNAIRLTRGFKRITKTEIVFAKGN